MKDVGLFLSTSSSLQNSSYGGIVQIVIPSDRWRIHCITTIVRCRLEFARSSLVTFFHSQPKYYNIVLASSRTFPSLLCALTILVIHVLFPHSLPDLDTLLFIPLFSTEPLATTRRPYCTQDSYCKRRKR